MGVILQLGRCVACLFSEKAETCFGQEEEESRTSFDELSEDRASDSSDRPVAANGARHRPQCYDEICLSFRRRSMPF